MGRLVELAQAAEECGFGAVVAGEVAGPDVFGLLGAVAASTRSVRIGTGVIAIGVRPPALAAMGFATLASLAPGRVFAGIGVSSPTVVAGWHGRAFGPPLAVVREFVPALRTALRGARLDVEGRHVRASGFRLTLPAQAEVPVVLAAMNPRMLRLAGEIADGVFLTWCPPDEVPAKLALVHEGAERAGRDPAELLVVASFLGYGGPRPEAALERLRRYLVAYATVPTHRASFAGSVERLADVERAWRRGDRREALRLVGDEAVHRLCAVGDGEVVAERARALAAAGVDLPVVLAVAAEPGDEEGPFATVRGTARALGLAE